MEKFGASLTTMKATMTRPKNVEIAQAQPTYLRYMIEKLLRKCCGPKTNQK
jgi:hypothetical protein